LNWCCLGRAKRGVIEVAQILSVLKVHPEHSKKNAKRTETENAILVVGEIDRGFGEEKTEGPDTRHYERPIEENPLEDRICLACVFVAKVVGYRF
jgi:hypothetical protein